MSYQVVDKVHLFEDFRLITTRIQPKKMKVELAVANA